MKNKRLKLFALGLCLTAAVFSFAACGKKDTEETASEETTTETTEEETTPVHDGSKSYLTGLDLDEELVAQRPIAVMIPNDSEATHCGLSQAGVIFESPAEGGITRIMAIFDDWHDLDMIGCVRSTRPYYINMANQFQCILVHYGYSIHAQVMIEDQHAIDNINGLKSNYFYRSIGTAPDNAYTSAELVEKAISTYGYDTNYSSDYQGHFTFAADGEEETLSDGEDCEVMRLYYPNRKSTFVYDADTKLYTHYQWGDVHKDEDNGEAITVTNVIFQNVENTTYEETQYLNITDTGSGEGKYFTEGKMIDVKWVNTAETDNITKYYDSDGNEIVLNPGKTYICYIQAPNADDNKYYATYDEYKASK